MNNKQSPERELLLAAMAYGAATRRITVSRLMSPDELTAVARARPDLQGKVEGWFLCAEVPEGMWQRALEARLEGVPNKLTIVEMASGRKYLSVVIQMHEWQHRLCVPLVGKLTAQWLDTLVSGAPLQMSVASAESEQSFISLSEVPPGAIASLRDADTSVPADWRELMDEAMTFVAWNSAAARVDRVDGMPEPGEVSLSLLFPAELEAELERRSDTAAGRKVS
jgi:hypothetical protein